MLLNFKADIIVDMATLTGAQGIATGKYHASILSNNDDWEAVTVDAGKVSGDLCHPVPFTPELHFSEFSSPVADMQVCVLHNVTLLLLVAPRHLALNFFVI